MKIFNLKNFTKGWFLGDFSPTLLKTKKFEMAIKRYKAGEFESSHFHKKAEEYTVIISGKVKMNNKFYKEDDIILISKNDITNFKAITESITCVIKIPCVKGDKYVNDIPQRKYLRSRQRNRKQSKSYQ